jgi:hypothetical protein
MSNHSNNESGAPAIAKHCETLDLDVLDGNIDWEVRFSNLADKEVERGEKQKARLDLEGDKRETIELLSGLLRLLVDVSPQGEKQREVVEVTLLRLAKRLGELLYGVLFSDSELRRNLIQSMNNIRLDKTDLLRIELEFSGKDANLASWPWEYLRSPEVLGVAGSGEFIAQTAKLILNRTMHPRFDGTFSTQKPVLLLVVSRPDALGPVEGGDVVNKIQSMHDEKQLELHLLVEPEHNGLIDQNYRPTASWGAFDKAVETHRPNIIHFIGHGRLSFDKEQGKEIGELAFVDSNGKADWISERTFAKGVGGGALRLVFLQACESALADPRANISGVAMRLAHQQVPAVIAMQSKVQNLVANKFAVRFYGMLGDGVPIDWAVKEARDEVGRMKGLTESQKLAFGTPVVFLSSYGGLIDRSVGGEALPLGRGAGSSTQERPLRPTLPVCPKCGYGLSERDRLNTYCPKCGLQLRCIGKDCNEPLDDPTGTNYCGACGTRIAPHEAVGTVAPSQRDVSSAPLPPSAPGLEGDLRMKFPFKLPPANG